MRGGKLNPFRGLPNPREVWAWGMYDLANQSFTLFIITMYFGLFVMGVVAEDADRGAALWGWLGSGSMLAVVVLSPFVGAVADARRWKKRLLIGTGVVCASLTCAFAGLGPGAVVATALLFIPANIAYNLGENLLASFLPEIASRQNMGRVSATGWAMGYLGALTLLAISVALILAFKWEHPEQYRPLFVLAGVWFLAAAVPTMLFLRERPAEPELRKRSVHALAWARLAGTVREASRFAHLLRFLAVFFVYAMGVQAVIYFAGIIVKDEDGFGFSPIKLTIFILQQTITATIAAIVIGRVQDRLGHVRTISVVLVVWIVGTGGLATLLVFPDPPEWVFWVVANGVGLGLGGIGTASRALVGVFTPAPKTAEFFGLWGMTYKFAGVVGIGAFGEVWSFLPGAPSLFLLAAVFGVGLVLVNVVVDERAGEAAAHEAEENLVGVPVTARDEAARAAMRDEQPGE